MKVVSKVLIKIVSILVVSIFVLPASSFAREIGYDGGEARVFVKAGEPTQVTFPSAVQGGFKTENSNFALERQGNYVIIFARPTLLPEGEAFIVHLDDQRTFSLRVLPAGPDNVRDSFVNLRDLRSPDVLEDFASPQDRSPDKVNQPRGFAPPSVVSGLMREVVLRAEFGKRKSIPGYRHSNRYAGETILHDGAMEAKIIEIVMGANLWAYVVEVENKLDTAQRINPASFRIDGTRAVTAQRWELAPQPLTEEQKLANSHKSLVYIVTRSRR